MLSERIVHFIAGLLPLYVEDLHGGIYCARSLVDGTLVLPEEEDEDNENGMVDWKPDLEVTSLHGLKAWRLKFECKMFTGDIGRQIHCPKALDLVTST